MTVPEQVAAIAILISFPLILVIPTLCRWGVETGGYRYLCLTRKGAERLAAHARAIGQDAIVIRLD